MVAENGTPCSEGECLDGVCAPVGAFPCTEQGIRDAIAAGGGPHFFACDGRTTVVLEAVIVIDQDVILDGEGALVLDGRDLYPMLQVTAESAAELRAFELTDDGSAVLEPNVLNSGELTLTRCALSNTYIDNQGTLTVTESTSKPGVEWEYAGGRIVNYGTATVTSCAFSGTHIVNYGSLMVTDSGFSGASTPSDGAALSGIFNREGGTATLIGSSISGSEINGIENAGTMTVRRSTISGNGRFSVPVAGVGGIQNTSTATLTLTNSTVSENSGQLAGGIDNSGGTLHVASSTVSGNTTSVGGSAIDNNNGGMVTLRGSLIDGDCSQGTGTFTSIGHNVESPGDTCGFDQASDQAAVSNGALNLDPLADNGGPTQTHALRAGSVAIDQIPVAACLDAEGAALTEDQRGEARPESGGSMCDVGAFEVQAGP